MFDARFNNGYQNTVTPLNTDPYGDQYLNQMSQNSYTQSNVLPNMMSNNTPYPVSPSQSVPAANVASRNTVAYAGGGIVGKSNMENNPYPSMAEMIRRQGNDEDTILAHINPLEAMILKNMGGSGTINKKTGLPEFFFGRLFTNPVKTITKAFKNPGKTASRFIGNTVAPIGGAILGNMVLPGLGGIIGGGLGGGVGSAAIGKKFGSGAAMGALTGALLPTAASAAGWGAKTLGADRLGATLTNYGNTNAILPSLGKMFGVGSGEHTIGSYVGGSRTPQSLLAANILMGGGRGNSSSPTIFEANDQGSALKNYNRYHSLSGVSAGDKEEQSFTDKLLGNTKDYLSQPGNLLTLASVAGSFMNRPKEKKEKTPEQQADEHKRLERALRLSPAERADMEANLLAEEQMRRRIARRKFLPEERLGNIEPLYRKSNTPEEYKKYGKWLSYYNNPEFSGAPIPYNKGGLALPKMIYEAEEMEYPSGLGRYIAGDTNGQDDKIPALLSDGEYVIPADVVAHLGDGNNSAGAKKLDMALKNIRKHKGGIINKLPPKAKSLVSYIQE